MKSCPNLEKIETTRDWFCRTVTFFTPSAQFPPQGAGSAYSCMFRLLFFIFSNLSYLFSAIQHISSSRINRNTSTRKLLCDLLKNSAYVWDLFISYNIACWISSFTINSLFDNSDAYFVSMHSFSESGYLHCIFSTWEHVHLDLSRHHKESFCLDVFSTQVQEYADIQLLHSVKTKTNVEKGN